MKVIDPCFIKEILNQIVPDYAKTDSLVSGIHNIVIDENNDLKTLLLKHAEYVYKMAEDLPTRNFEYSIILHAYYYYSLADLNSKYSLEEIFSTIDSIPSYDYIDKIMFKVIFKVISEKEAIDHFIQEITPEKLSIISHDERKWVKWGSDKGDKCDEMSFSWYFKHTIMIVKYIITLSISDTD